MSGLIGKDKFHNFELWTKDGISPTDPSPFVDHTSYSCFLAFTSFILIYKIVYSSNLTWRYFYIIYFLTALTNLFINELRYSKKTVYLCR